MIYPIFRMTNQLSLFLAAATKLPRASRPLIAHHDIMGTRFYPIRVLLAPFCANAPLPQCTLISPSLIDDTVQVVWLMLSAPQVVPRVLPTITVAPQCRDSSHRWMQTIPITLSNDLGSEMLQYLSLVHHCRRCKDEGG